MHYHYVVMWDTDEQCFKLDWGTTLQQFEDSEIYDGSGWLSVQEFPAIGTDYYLVSDKLVELCGGSY